jgi:uncharacterized membrane protein SpoIIM required for sporulation/uncharacterized RDD family membrane protein YckC
MATVQAPRAAQRSLEQYVDVETPEQVVFSYTVAGVGSRAAAALIDTLICVVAFVALVVLAGYLSGAFDSGRVRTGSSSSGQWAAAVLSLFQFAILWGYYVLFEALADGQTPGKKRLGLRVVQDGGYSVSFAASAVRNLVRVIDMQPAFFYGVGIFSVAVSRSGKRLGDMAAGTLVVRERGAPEGALATDDLAPAEVASSGGAALATLLTDDEYELLDRFVQRRSAIDAVQRAQFAAQLAGRWRARAPEIPGSDAAMLIRLHERERLARRRGTAARSDTGARREQHAIVAAGMPRWRRFAAALAGAQRGGLQRLPEEQVSAFVAEYRELSSDLARLRTASRGRDPESLFYLGRLVAGGHNLFYRRRTLPLGTAWRYVALDVPREIRRSWRAILLASLLLYGPAVAAYTAVRIDPSSAPMVVPASLAERAQSGAKRGNEGSEFLPSEMGNGRGPALAAFLMTHNASVTYGAFAAGLSFGLGTVYALVSNGVMLGGPIAYYQQLGTAGQILGFIAPHGVFELTAITFGGGAGFLLAAALLLPGVRTRRAALVVNSRRAIRLVAGATLFLLCAGLLEGNVSPSPLPNEAKFFVSAVTGLLILFYVTRGRGGEAEVRDQHAYE